MSANLAAIKEKIRRLLAVAENHASAEGEIETAMRVATQLMTAHQLSREDVANLSEQDRAGRIAYGKHACFTFGANFTLWESRLANFCADFIGTCRFYYASKIIRRRDGVAVIGDTGAPLLGTRITFYGPDDDAAFCCELFEEISVAIATLARLRWGGFARGAGGSYCEGFAEGLSEANRKELERLEDSSDAQTRSLVLRSNANAIVIRKDAQAWLEKSEGIRLGRGRGRSGVSSGFSSEAFSEGRSDGRKYEVGKQSRPKRIR